MWRKWRFILQSKTSHNEKDCKSQGYNFRQESIRELSVRDCAGFVAVQLPRAAKGVNYMVIGDPGVGKTTVVLDLMANIHKVHPDARVLFVSAEMNEIDLAIYVQRYPKFGDLDIMFVEADFDSEAHVLEDFEEVLNEGWDIVAVDSFYELQGIVKEEQNITLKKSESLLLSIIKKQNKAGNSRGVHTSFLTIQQVTKSGAFIGSNRLKHRRGDVGVKLYFSLSRTGDVYFDEERFLNDKKLRKLQSEVSSQLYDYADKFNKQFNNIQDDDK